MAQIGETLCFKRFFGAIILGISLAEPAVATDAHAKPVAGMSAAAGVDAAAKAAPVLRPGLAGSFLSGRFAKQNQNLKEAAHYLAQTLESDPKNEKLQQETMRMYLLAGEIAPAIQLAHVLADAKNNEPLVASLLMLESVKNNDFVAAKATLKQASGTGLFGLIRPVMLEWLSVASGEKMDAVSLDMRAAIDKAGFFAPFMNYHVGLMHDLIGNKAAASAAYAKANIDPAVTPYRVVEAIANFHIRQGKWDEAQKMYDAYATANPQSSLIPGKLVAGQTVAPMVADAKQGLAEIFFTTASILFGEDATQDTFLYLRLALELRPNLPPAQLMLANLYEQVADYKQAIETYDAIAEDSVFYRRGQIRKALNYEALGQKPKALALLEAIAVRYPSDATPLITKGDIERDAKNYTLAAQTYSNAIARTEPLKASDWPLLYARGISYERSGDWKKAEADLMRALKLQPDQPDVLNYLAYSWLTMHKNLPQAREYLETALAQRPEDGPIIDSLGLAYYLNGDFKLAVEKFERAIEITPDDPTVNDHLGDAYWRVGREVEARYQWERALNFNPEKELIATLKEKIANGLKATATKQPDASARRMPGAEQSSAATPVSRVQ